MIYFVILVYTNKTEEIQLRNEIQLKAQIIVDLNKHISQLQSQNSNQEVMISQLEKDVQQLNQTIEKMCEQLTASNNDYTTELKQLQDQIINKDKVIKFFKAENQQLLSIIKQGSFDKTKVDKENQPNITQANQQDQINYLKDQIDLQRKQFQQTEDSLQKQITGLNLFVNEIFQQQSSDRLNTNISSRNDKDSRNRKLSLQNDMDTFQSQLQQLDKQKHKLDNKFDNIQCNLNQLNSVCNDNFNTQNMKETIKLKQIVQIQKKQIELQQKTILNQHFEIQNLQTLLYKNDQDSVPKKKEIKEIQEDIITNEFTNSPKDEIYHLNDSQSEIKPKYYLDNIQNTFQKFQVIQLELLCNRRKHIQKLNSILYIFKQQLIFLFKILQLYQLMNQPKKKVTLTGDQSEKSKQLQLRVQEEISNLIRENLIQNIKIRIIQPDY